MANKHQHRDSEVDRPASFRYLPAEGFEMPPLAALGFVERIAVIEVDEVDFWVVPSPFS
jgi:hypothetical protein